MSEILMVPDLALKPWKKILFPIYLTPPWFKMGTCDKQIYNLDSDEHHWFCLMSKRLEISASGASLKA